MIAVDTSALMAILLDEPDAGRISDALQREDEIVISAGTLAEALVVAGHRQVADPLLRLVEGLGISVEPVTEAGARRVAEAYGAWGKGVHRARLNLGDCFAYALAKERGCPLLFVGDDFARTDVARA